MNLATLQKVGRGSGLISAFPQGRIALNISFAPQSLCARLGLKLCVTPRQTLLTFALTKMEKQKAPAVNQGFF